MCNKAVIVERLNVRKIDRNLSTSILVAIAIDKQGHSIQSVYCRLYDIPVSVLGSNRDLIIYSVDM